MSRRHAADFGVVVHRRTPIVRIELQLWPPPPLDAEPYWWGNHDLDFKDDVRRTVWRQTLEVAAHGSARVEKRDDYGWVLVLTLTHDKARKLLEAGGLPSTLEPAALALGAPCTPSTGGAG